MRSSRRILLMLSLTAAIVASGVALNYLSNPYGAWRLALLDPVFRRVAEEHVVTPYLVRTTEPETILLGTSRVLLGIPIDQGERGDVLNAALSAARIGQLAQIVDVALENPRLRRIVWGVDFFEFDRVWERRDPVFDARIGGSPALRFEETLLSLQALRDGYRMFQRALKGRAKLPGLLTVPAPWPKDLICDEFRKTKNRGLIVASPTEVANELSQDMHDYLRYQFSPEIFALFQDTVARARARGVDVILFVPPMSQYELELIRQSGQWETFRNFKRALATIGPFWDFSGYNEIARSDVFFMHMMHFKAAVGMEILRVVLGMDAAGCEEPAGIVARSAMRLDSATMDQALAAQDRMLAHETAHETRYSRLSAQALARHALERGETPASGASAPATGKVD